MMSEISRAAGYFASVVFFALITKPAHACILMQDLEEGTSDDEETSPVEHRLSRFDQVGLRGIALGLVY